MNNAIPSLSNYSIGGALEAVIALQSATTYQLIKQLHAITVSIIHDVE